MPVTSLPVTPETLAALRGGDEHALETVFRASVDSLTRAASAELDQPASIARVVEIAVCRAWDMRATFETTEQLERFLDRAVHEAAVREKSRLAAVHRFENSAHTHATGKHHETSADEIWARIARGLPSARVDTGEIQHRMADESRHHAAEHVADIAKPTNWVLPAAIAVVLGVVVFGAVWMMNRASQDAAITSVLNSADLRVVQTRAGQLGDITLDDGTAVHLGADTKLTRPQRNATELRVAKLDGTATFNVKKDETHPFYLRAGNATLIVTGTQLAVRAYPEEKTVLVRVTDGHVTAKANGDTRELAANGSLMLDSSGKWTTPSQSALDEGLSWTSGEFVVAGRPLRTTLPQYQRWYGMTLLVKDTTLLARRVVMRSSLDSPRDAIAALETSAGVKFGYDGQTPVLRDSSDKANPPAKPAKKH